jgi:phosphomannomutase
MKLLKVGISGVRGIVGETLTPELAVDFASAFGTHLGPGRVLVGRDTRPSGPMLRSAVVSALLSSGCDVQDLGVCPTPVLQRLVRALKARGGVSITAGHSGAEWNALTFIGGDGAYLDEFEGNEVLDLYHLEAFALAPSERLGGLLPPPRGATAGYFRALARFLRADAIRRARFKVVVDPCNGAGAGFVDELFQTLGCELVPVNDKPTGVFPHDPEPRPRNAGEVASIVRITSAQAGFLLNSDGSRLSCVAEDGETLSEEYAFPIIADHVLCRRRGTVVTNLSTSRMIEDVARRHGCPVVRARVGQSPIIQTLLAEDGVLAGDGSGSVALPAFQPAFDAFLMMGLILEALATRKATLGGLVRALPKYHIVKDKIPCPPERVHTVVQDVRSLFPGRPISLLDGVRAEDEEGWVHVRASATEPMIRVIVEDRSLDKAQAEMERVSLFVQGRAAGG